MSIINTQNRMELLANPNVLRLKAKQIVYSTTFILSAIEAHNNGVSSNFIWKSAGFNIEYFHKDYFRKSISRWKTQLINGEIIHEKKGPRTDIFLTKDEELEFVKAENSILKELRALGVSEKILDSGLSLELFRKIKTSHLPGSVEWRELAQVVFTNGLIEHLDH